MGMFAKPETRHSLDKQPDRDAWAFGSIQYRDKKKQKPAGKTEKSNNFVRDLSIPFAVVSRVSVGVIAGVFLRD